MAEEVGQATLRSEMWERDVKGFALQSYRMKQLCMVSKTGSWTNSYYQETASDLTANGTRNVKGLGRGSQFPTGNVSWTEKSARIQKYGMEGEIFYEDAITDNIDVTSRTLLRIGRAIAKAVDDEIWDVISESQSPTLINSVTISAGSEWDSATIANRDPVQNILDAKKEIAIDNYDPDNGNGYLIVSPTDYANLLGNTKISNNPSFRGADVVANGVVAKLLGLKIIVSNSVTADYAMVAIAKECASWKALTPLTVLTNYDAGIKWTIRGFEFGVTQLTNPEAICLIIGTQE